MSKRLWSSLILVSMVAGCVLRLDHSSEAFRSSVALTPGPSWPDEDSLLLRYEERGGHAALESKRCVIVFHGLSLGQQRLFHFQDSQQAIQINGPGISSVSTTCSSGKETVTFRSDYANGTNTIQFGEQRIKLADKGRTLLVADEVMDLSGGRWVVHLKGGRATLEPMPTAH